MARDGDPELDRAGDGALRAKGDAGKDGVEGENLVSVEAERP